MADPEDAPEGHGQLSGGLSAIARAAAKRSFDDLPDDVIRLAKYCLLDWAAVTAAAIDYPGVLDLRAMAAPRAGNCTIVGTEDKAFIDDALLINGTAGHILDYDDVHSAIPGHVTVAIAPVVLALAETLGSSGKAVITAFVAGFEAMCEIARLLGPSHPQRGFHATATLGTFGATVAAAHMLNCDGQQVASALAIGSTQSAGLRAAFGTFCKSLQVGRASVNGHLSASLAKRGIAVPETVFSGRDGFAVTHSDADARSFGAPRGYYLRDVVFKFSASCFVTHAPIECLRRAMEHRPFKYNEVQLIEIRVNPAAESICAIPDPTSALESKFSLHQTAAMTLAGIDTGDIKAFDDETLFDSLKTWREKINLVFDTTVAQTASIVAIQFTDGSGMTREHNSNRPEDELDRLGERLSDKFRALVVPLLGAAKAENARASMLRLDGTASAASTMATLVP